MLQPTESYYNFPAERSARSRTWGSERELQTKGTGGKRMDGQKDRTRSATLAALGTCVIYGFSFMFSRIALEHAPAAVMLAIRFMTAMFVMFLLLAFRIFTIDLKGKPVGRFLLMGLCQPVIYFISETSGIQYTSSSFSGIMIATIPVATAVLSAIILKEKMPLSTFGWIICSVIGAFVISATQTSSGNIQLKGVLFLLTAVLSAAVFYILSRSTANVFTPFERTFIMMLLGCVYFTVQAAVQYKGDFIPLLRSGFTDWHLMLPILYLSVLSSVVAFLLQNYSVTYLELAKITVFENIIPVISVAAGVLFLHEPFSAVQLAGMALILLGVYKVTTA